MNQKLTYLIDPEKAVSSRGNAVSDGADVNSEED
jgi:hypothetical protein